MPLNRKSVTRLLSTAASYPSMAIDRARLDNRESSLNTKFCHSASHCCRSLHQSKSSRRCSVIKEKNSTTRMRQYRVHLLTGLPSSSSRCSPISRDTAKRFCRASCLKRLFWRFMVHLSWRVRWYKIYNTYKYAYKT